MHLYVFVIGQMLLVDIQLHVISAAGFTEEAQLQFVTEICGQEDF